MNPKISAGHLERRAVIYVRQSTQKQVLHNRESQNRQYGLAGQAQQMGFAAVETIDDDLGISGSGLERRPGFQRLVAEVCGGGVGAVFCIEASRLARNGTDWHHLVELCGLTNTLLIDGEEIYDPRLSTDRLVLGLKGAVSEYELGLFRKRAVEAQWSKARRGEMQCALPAGYLWVQGATGGKIEKDPDLRIQHGIQQALDKFAELGSVYQLLMYYREQGIEIPAIKTGRQGRGLRWAAPTYSGLLSMVRNPVYAGAYAYGKTETRLKIEDGRARKSSSNRKPRTEWTIVIRDHHPVYISWEQFETNQRRLRENNLAQSAQSRRSGRGGEALLTGLLRCGLCGAMMYTSYPRAGLSRYRCCRNSIDPGRCCQSFASRQADRRIAAAVFQAIQPSAIDAALAAAARQSEAHRQCGRALELELEQARHDERLACRRYESVDATNRLVAAQLEERWNGAMEKVKQVEAKLETECGRQAGVTLVETRHLRRLAEDLPEVWNSCDDTRLKRKIVKTLIEEIVAKLDAEANQVVLTVHWVGGRHSEIRIDKPNRKLEPDPAAGHAREIVQKMGGQFPDNAIAATLNLNGLRTANGGRWRLNQVRQMRAEFGLPDYSEDRNSLTALQAAIRLQVDIGTVRRMLVEKLLPGEQVVKFAPWRIPVAALSLDRVVARIEAIRKRIKPTGKPGIDMLYLPGLEPDPES